MKKMQFSVSMCVYGKDNPEHFQQALQSVFNQTLPPDEVVLVIDGPIPSTTESVIKLFEVQNNLNVIKLHKNVGHGNARKIGLENCTYPYVAIMDADDISVPERFEKQIACFAKDDQLSIVGGFAKNFVGDIGNIVSIHTRPTEDVDIKIFMRKRCPFSQVTVMFKKNDVINAGGYIDWFCAEDYYLWIRMYQKGFKFKNIPECLVYVRCGEDQYRRRGGWRYFKSEARLQGYMLRYKIIGFSLYLYNVGIRFVVQVLLPNRIRGYVYKTFARKAVE